MYMYACSKCSAYYSYNEANQLYHRYITQKINNKKYILRFDINDNECYVYDSTHSYIVKIPYDNNITPSNFEEKIKKILSFS